MGGKRFLSVQNYLIYFIQDKTKSILIPITKIEAIISCTKQGIFVRTFSLNFCIKGYIKRVNVIVITPQRKELKGVILPFKLKSVSE